MKKKSKKWMAYLLIMAGVGLLLISGTFGTGFMGAITPAAYGDYITEFDPASSSLECQGLHPEFELVSADLPSSQTGTVVFPMKPKTICGVSGESAAYNESTQKLALSWYSIGSDKVSVVSRGWVTPIDYTIIGSYNLSLSNLGETNVGDLCEIYSSRGLIYSLEGEVLTKVSGTLTQGRISDGEYECMLEQPVIIKAGTNTWSDFQPSVNNISGTFMTLYLDKKMPAYLSIDYSTIRTDILSYPHFREFSCPLESGRMLMAETFVAGELIDINSFAYKPNYFCKRHGIIKTELATQRSVESTQEYVDLVEGRIVEVPAGDTWTFFYVPPAAPDVPFVCLEGDYYDVETENCVKLVSGFVYICTDPETTQIGNQCVKEVELMIICPNGEEPVDGKCYVLGEESVRCPEGYIKENDKCYIEGEEITDCPEGYTPRDGACYIPGTPLIDCPEGYHQEGGVCKKLGDLITECPTEEGYVLRDGGCWRSGDKITVCPDGTHEEIILDEEKCIIDSTYCPDGYKRVADKCLKEGDITCPSGTIKIGGICEVMSVVCPKGSIEINNQCVKDGEVFCPEGTEKEVINNVEVCYKPGEVKCPIGTVQIGDLCIRSDAVCPLDTEEMNGKCVRGGEIVCPYGTEKVGEKCVKEAICPADTTLLDGKCLRAGEIVCPDGTIEVNNQCVKGTVCPEGTTDLGNGKCGKEPFGVSKETAGLAGIVSVLSGLGMLVLKI